MREKTIAIDFESTYGIEDDHGISKQGGKYFTDPRTDVYLVAFYDGADSWVGHPKDAPWGVLEGATVVAHNWAFEKAVLDVYRDQWGVPPEDKFQPHDTAALAAYLRSPRSLEAAAECLLGEKPDKDVRAQMEGKTANELRWDFGGLWDEILHYAAEDARLCWDLWDRYEHFWPEHERFLSNLQIEMGCRGLPLDVDGMTSDLTILAGELAESEQQIPWYGKAPIASQTELARAIRQHADSGRGFELLTGELVYDIPVPASIADGDWRWEKWLASYGAAFPAASAMKRYTKAKLRLDRIKGMLAREHDGRMGYSTMYFGAHCLTPGHEVLTRDGWVPIETWVGGEIAQWSPYDESIQFLPATPNKFFYQGDLYQLDAPYAKGVFTPDHGIPSFTYGSETFSRVLAKDAADRCVTRIPVSGNYVGVDGGLGPVEMKLLAAFQADGCWQWSRPEFFFHKERKKQRLRGLLREAQIEFRELTFPSHPKGTKFIVELDSVPGWWTEDRKRFGPWLLEASAEGLQAFADELQKWDGWTAPEKGNHQFFSTNLEDIQWAETALHLTGRAGKHCTKAGTGVRSDAHTIAIRRRTKTRAERKHWTRQENYEGGVFCPTTRTGYFLYRYKGVIGITGNSGRPTGGEKMNVLNMPKDDIAGTNIRHRIAAADDRKLVVRDLSAIEPCCLHAMLGHTEFCDMVREGTDVYEAAARLQGLYDGDQPLKDADPDLRGQVKVGELAAVYGQGAARLAEQWKIPVDEAKRRVRKWRRDNPDITRQWKMFERQLANKIGGDLHIKLPSGRNMSFYQVTHDGVNDWGKPNLKASVTRDGERMRRLWGSIITENACQSVARDVFSHGLILAEQAGLNPVLTVYDEIICDVPAAEAEDANQELDRCMTTPPEWMPTVPLRSEGKVVDRYSEAK